MKSATPVIAACIWNLPVCVDELGAESYPRAPAAAQTASRYPGPPATNATILSPWTG